MIKPLGVDEVRVRWVPTDQIGARHLSYWRRLLAPEEVTEGNRRRFDEDRTAFFAAHMLARTMLSEATGCEIASWRFATGVYGKPSVGNLPEGLQLFFNISHTRGCAACAIARHDVGVDVEALDVGMNWDVAELVFTHDENHLLASTPPDMRASLFFRLWTLKEAFVKATGEGLNRPLLSFAFSLDPVRIRFTSQRMHVPEYSQDWQFAERHPVDDLALAIAVRQTVRRPIRLDLRAMAADEILDLATSRACGGAPRALGIAAPG